MGGGASPRAKSVCEHRCVHTETRRWRREERGVYVGMRGTVRGRRDRQGTKRNTAARSTHMSVTSAGVCVLHSQQIERTSEGVRMRRSCRVAEEEEESILPHGETAHAAHTPSGTLCRFPDN